MSPCASRRNAACTAFLLAEYTNVSYREGVIAALVLALLSYLGVFLQLHLRPAETFRTGWVFLIPIANTLAVVDGGNAPARWLRPEFPGAAAAGPSCAALFVPQSEGMSRGTSDFA